MTTSKRRWIATTLPWRRNAHALTDKKNSSLTLPTTIFRRFRCDMARIYRGMKQERQFTATPPPYEPLRKYVVMQQTAGVSMCTIVLEMFADEDTKIGGLSKSLGK